MYMSTAHPDEVAPLPQSGLEDPEFDEAAGEYRSAVSHDMATVTDPNQLDADPEDSVGSKSDSRSSGGGNTKRRRMTADERLIRSRERNRHHAKMTRMRKKQKMEHLQVRSDVGLLKLKLKWEGDGGRGWSWNEGLLTTARPRSGSPRTSIYCLPPVHLLCIHLVIVCAMPLARSFAACHKN